MFYLLCCALTITIGNIIPFSSVTIHLTFDVFILAPHLHLEKGDFHVYYQQYRPRGLGGSAFYCDTRGRWIDSKPGQVKDSICVANNLLRICSFASEYIPLWPHATHENLKSEMLSLHEYPLLTSASPSKPHNIGERN